MMIRAQESLHERGVQFVGIALDRVEDVKSFIAEYPLNYPVLIGNPESVELSRRLGNRLQGLALHGHLRCAGTAGLQPHGRARRRLLGSGAGCRARRHRTQPRAIESAQRPKTSS